MSGSGLNLLRPQPSSRPCSPGRRFTLFPLLRSVSGSPPADLLDFPSSILAPVLAFSTAEIIRNARVFDTALFVHVAVLIRIPLALLAQCALSVVWPFDAGDRSRGVERYFIGPCLGRSGCFRVAWVRPVQTGSLHSWLVPGATRDSSIEIMPVLLESVSGDCALV